MSEPYIVPAKEAEYEFTEKRSRFIGHIFKIESAEQAQEILARMRKKYWDATHNVYAYVLKGGVERFSDDGEPHGTAGMPVLDSIRKAGITDTAVVVTRYFGGILLGTGGLVRAYTQAASGAVKAADIAEVGEFSLVSLHCGYSEYQKIMPFISSFGAKIEDSDFSTDVDLVVSVREESAERFISDLVELTNGRVNSDIVGSKTDFV